LWRFDFIKAMMTMIRNYPEVPDKCRINMLRIKGWAIPTKQKYKLRNWSEYNEALRRRGDITIWLSSDAVAQWYKQDRVAPGEI
jgi:hypothetical protein